MERTGRNPAPETLLEKVTAEALSILALGGAAGIPDIAPLEASLPLIAKAWHLPEIQTREASDLLAKGKEQAARGEAVLPERSFLVNYDGFIIAGLLWDLFETAAKLDSAKESKAIYEAALLSAKALDFKEWLSRFGKNTARELRHIFETAAEMESPAERRAAYNRALLLADRMNFSSCIHRCA